MKLKSTAAQSLPKPFMATPCNRRATARELQEALEAAARPWPGAPTGHVFNRTLSVAAVLVLLALSACATRRSVGPSAAPTGQPNPVVRTEFIYEQAPFPSCHASTVAETRDGLVAAWFGGTAEKNPDVGIWCSRQQAGRWTAPVEVANGVQSDGQRHPCWNPVLYQPKQGPLLLFYKVGPSPSRWWGMLLASDDAGRTWSPPRRLPEGILGPIKNKPVALPDGTLLCPSSTEHAGWRIHLERTPDLGRTWTRTEPLNDGKEFGAIQPAVLIHPEGRLQLLCRSRHRVITECWSADGGRTWGPMRATGLPNPDAGLDAVTLKDGRHLLVFNPTTRGRTPLSVALSPDGIAWTTIAVLESDPGEYSYPAVIQARDGSVHVTYTWKRQRIKHVVLDLRRAEPHAPPGS
jgi:predicted neuraminidase